MIRQYPDGTDTHRSSTPPGQPLQRLRRVPIDRIDEYGQPWFNYTLVDRDGVAEEHTLVVIDDDSWTRA